MNMQLNYQCREESLNTAVCTMLCHQTHDVTANFTSNVTEVRSVNFGLVTECHHYNACHVANIFHNRVCYHVLSLHYARIRSSGIILIPTLPLCQISFLLRPPLLSQPVEKNCILNQSITQSLTQLIWCPGNRSLCFKIRRQWHTALGPLSEELLNPSIPNYKYRGYKYS